VAEELAAQRWWQTVPGILTAIAATVTAVTGLILALQQTGVIGGNATSATGAQQNSTTPSAPREPADATPGPGPAQAVATRQAIQMPDGRSVTMHLVGAKYQYTIVSAERQAQPPGKQLLHFRIRVWTDSSSGLLFWNDSFRVSVGELRFAPTTFVSRAVPRDTTDEDDVEFEIDDSVKEATLVISVGGLNLPGNTKQLRLVIP
jgi:hypothetical protein